MMKIFRTKSSIQSKKKQDLDKQQHIKEHPGSYMVC